MFNEYQLPLLICLGVFRFITLVAVRGRQPAASPHWNNLFPCDNDLIYALLSSQQALMSGGRPFRYLKYHSFSIYPLTRIAMVYFSCVYFPTNKHYY